MQLIDRYPWGVFSCLVAPSYLLQLILNIHISEGFIAALLTTFSIISAFYLSIFTFFTSSKYLSTLRQIQDPKCNSRTLLHTLMALFKTRIHCLLYTIIYIIILYIIFINKDNGVFRYLSINSNADYKNIMFYFSPFSVLWGLTIYNILYIMSSITIFIKIFLKSVPRTSKKKIKKYL